MTANSNAASVAEEPKSMEKEINLAKKHEKSLADMYEVIENGMQELKKLQASRNDSKEWQEEWNKKFGAKETVTTIGTRLLRAFHKIIPMEKEAIARLKEAETKNAPIFDGAKFFTSEAMEKRSEERRMQWKEEMIRAGYRLVAPPQEEEIPEDAEVVYISGYKKNEW